MHLTVHYVEYCFHVMLAIAQVALVMKCLQGIFENYNLL